MNLPADREKDVVGLVPAGGWAKRIAPIPCSKEILPVGFDQYKGKVRVVSEYLLDNFRESGISTAFVVLRPDKWDIPVHLGNGRSYGVNLAYLMVDEPYGMPFTLDAAYPFVHNSLVALGLADVIIKPLGCYRTQLEKLEASGADVVLGLFPAQDPSQVDMVTTGLNGMVRRIDVKPAHSKQTFTWMTAVWTPRFGEFLHLSLAKRRGLRTADSSPSEVHIGEVFQSALSHGLTIQSVAFETGSCLDIGTPENLMHAVAENTPDITRDTRCHRHSKKNQEI